MKPLALAFLLLTISQTTLASINCTEYLRRHGSFQFQRYEADDGTCFMSADPFNPPASFKYRSFLMTQDGLLMVFNSFGPGDGSDQHGARVFYFFPRGETPESEVLGDQTFLRSTTPGISLVLSQAQHRLTGMQGGKVLEAKTVSPSNQGGVEFSNVQTLYMDAGFMMGEDPTGRPNRSSQFIDIKKRTCTVKNSELFNYSSDGEPSFKFADQELKKFLAQRCPQLTVNF